MSLEEWIQKEESLVDSDSGPGQARPVDLNGLRSASETVRSSLTELLPDRFDTGSYTGIRAEYIGAIREMDRSLDRIVTAGDIEQKTEYSIDDITDTFGSWRAALDAAGIDIRSQIRIEIARLYRELGHAPSPAEMNANGHISAMMVENNFESYEAAIETVIPQSDTSTARDVVASHAPQIPDVLERTQESGGQAIDAAVTRADEVSLSELLPERESQLLPTVPGEGIEPPVPDPVEPLERLRESATELDEDRREFLKYAGVSVTLTTAVSSSDNLYGTDTASQEVAGFGYGGAPVLSGSDSGSDSKGGAAPVPEQTATPTATPTQSTPSGTTTPYSGSGTDNTTTADTSDDTTDSSLSDGSTDIVSGSSTDDGSGGSTNDGSGGTTDDGSTDDGSGGTTDDGDGGTTDDGSTDDGSGGSTDDGSTDDGSGGSTDDGDGGTTASEIDRYNDDLNLPAQAYGEQGYGGVTSA